MDFAEISSGAKPLIDRLDHHHLGTWGHILTDVNRLESEEAHLDWFVEGLPIYFYPSSENLLHWIGKELSGMVWSKLALEETCTSYAELTREEFNASHNES